MQSKRLPNKAVWTSSNRRPWSVPGSPVTHILAPTDLTADSRESVAWAGRLARGFDAKLPFSMSARALSGLTCHSARCMRGNSNWMAGEC